MTSTHLGTELACLYGDTFIALLERIWDLRITYPLMGPEGATMPAERLQATIWGVRGANLKRGSVRGESPTPYGAPTVEVYRGHWFLRGFRNLTPVPPVASYAGVPGA